MTHVKITNKTRGSFRRAGIRFPAKAHGSVIKAIEDLTDDQKEALQNEPRLKIEPCEDPEAKGLSKSKGKKGGNKKPAKTEKPSKAELDHERAMTAARKIKDPVKRQAAQTKANALLEASED